MINSFTLHAQDSRLLQEAKEVLEAVGERTGAVNSEPPMLELNFDLAQAVQTAYYILGILSTIGGAVSFVDWIVQKVKQSQGDEIHHLFVLKCNGQTIRITSDRDGTRLRTELQILLQIHSSTKDD